MRCENSTKTATASFRLARSLAKDSAQAGVLKVVQTVDVPRVARVPTLGVLREVTGHAVKAEIGHVVKVVIGPVVKVTVRVARATARAVKATASRIATSKPN